MQTPTCPGEHPEWRLPLSSTPCRIAGPLRALLADVTNRAGSPLGGASLARSSGTTGTSSPRTPRRTVNLREDNYELVSRAAEDPRVCQFIGGDSLESYKQANQEILITALKNHGVVSDGENGVRISMEPTHNRFVREANELEAKLEAGHAEQQRQHSAEVAELRTQLSAAVAACEIASARAHEQEWARQLELSKRWPTAAREAEQRADEQQRRAEVAEALAAQAEEALQIAGAQLDVKAAGAASLEVQLARALDEEKRWPAAARAAEQRAVKAEGGLSSAMGRASSAERALKKAESAREAACAEGETARGALRAAMQRRDYDDAPALQREALLAERTAGMASAEKRAGAAEIELQGARVSGGMASAKMRGLQVQLERVTAPPKARERTRVRALARKQAEVLAARAACTELRIKLDELQEAATLQRTRAAAEPPKLMQLRLRDTDTAALLPRTREFQRAMVDESNGSLEGAATQFSLAYQLLFGVPPPPHLSFSSKTIKKSFDVLGVVDERAEAAASRAAAAPWAFGADGGNKGNRPMNMVAVSEWSWAMSKPLASPLACGDLHKDQSAKNCAAICERAFERAGKLPALCCAGVSDGADAATQDIGGALDGQHAKHVGHRSARRRTRCIHTSGRPLTSGTPAFVVSTLEKPHPLTSPCISLALASSMQSSRQY